MKYYDLDWDGIMDDEDDFDDDGDGIADVEEPRLGFMCWRHMMLSSRKVAIEIKESVR